MKYLLRIFLFVSTIFLICTNAEKSLNESDKIAEEPDRRKLTKIVSISRNESGDLSQEPEERKKFSGMKFSGSKGSFVGTKLSNGKTAQKSLHTTGVTYRGGTTLGIRNHYIPIIVGFIVVLILIVGLLIYLNHDQRC